MSGIWVGVDVGTVRVGVARSDPTGILASPVTTLTRDPDGRDLDELARLIREAQAVGVVVGLPTTLSGREGRSAEMARDYAAQLAERIAPLSVQLLDERLTTVSAERKLHRSGVRGSRAVRGIIDQAAAVELLQHWLDTLRG
ncbi:MAG TPA: Holliday junction resolvase RuvX [Jatrophihabitantaceae bacterium]